jgi:hypothetical protein
MASNKRKSIVGHVFALIGIVIVSSYLFFSCSESQDRDIACVANTNWRQGDDRIIFYDETGVIKINEELTYFTFEEDRGFILADLSSADVLDEQQVIHEFTHLKDNRLFYITENRMFYRYE